MKGTEKDFFVKTGQETNITVKSVTQLYKMKLAQIKFMIIFYWIYQQINIVLNVQYDLKR